MRTASETARSLLPSFGKIWESKFAIDNGGRQPITTHRDGVTSLVTGSLHAFA